MQTGKRAIQTATLRWI